MKTRQLAWIGCAAWIGLAGCSSSTGEGGAVGQTAQRIDTCAHPICATGSGLDPTCNPCAATLCNQDPYCCTTAWDTTCVGEVGSICGQTCMATTGGGTSTCAHAVCATGVALTSSCDPCATKLCASDPYCCSVTWDATCVSEVAGVCGTSCN